MLRCCSSSSSTRTCLLLYPAASTGTIRSRFSSTGRQCLSTPIRRPQHPSSTPEEPPLLRQQQRKWKWETRRAFSDRLLGYSPMAQPTPSKAADATTTSTIPTAKDVTTAGGVWAPTSAKRDKLGELNLELDRDKGQTTLDDVATPEQLLDLYLADGIQLIASVTETTTVMTTTRSTTTTAKSKAEASETADQSEGDTATQGELVSSNAVLDEMDQWLLRQTEKFQNSQTMSTSTDDAAAIGSRATTTADDTDAGSNSEANNEAEPQNVVLLNQVQWEEHLRDTMKELDRMLSALPSDRYLRDIRDFYDPNGSASGLVVVQNKSSSSSSKDDTKNNKDGKEANAGSTTSDEDDPAERERAALIDACLREQRTSVTQRNFDSAVLRFRLQLTKAAAETLSQSWKELTTVSDQDVDRAAVQRHADGSGGFGGAAATKHDGDGGSSNTPLLPLHKLRNVLRAYLLSTACKRVDALWDLMDRDGDGLLDEAEMNVVCNLALKPVQSALGTLMEEAVGACPVRDPLPPWDDNKKNAEAELMPATETMKGGWLQRRRERKHKKLLLRMFRKTLKNHFEDEVELPHRLRCIYAWANKKHQNNKIDSVLVEAATTATGRKRYVELHPKISLEEFREVQREHLQHLDRVGAEYLKSFREDLWVAQGKRRQGREQMRDAATFFAVVCVLDGIISVH